MNPKTIGQDWGWPLDAVKSWLKVDTRALTRRRAAAAPSSQSNLPHDLRRSEPSATSLQRLVISGRESGEEIVLIEWEMLGKGNRHNLLLRVDLTIGSRGPVPTKLAN